MKSAVPKIKGLPAGTGGPQISKDIFQGGLYAIQSQRKSGSNFDPNRRTMASEAGILERVADRLKGAAGGSLESHELGLALEILLRGEAARRRHRLEERGRHASSAAALFEVAA